MTIILSRPRKKQNTMTIIKDGDSAFPRPVSWSEEGGTHRGTLGMTIRDYFAAQALAGVPWSYEISLKDQAKQCFQIADAMIAEREAKP